MSHEVDRLGRIALGAVSLCAWLAVSSHAWAQQLSRPSDDAELAGARAWFQEYIEPGLLAAGLSEEGKDLTVQPEKPGEHRTPKKPVPWPLVEVGSLGMLTLDPDVPLQRGDWNDVLQPAMFRLYFEPVPAPAAPAQTPPTPSAAGA